MKSIIHVIFSILLLGCSVPESSCQNITIEHNNTIEVIKEVNISSPCEPIIIEKNITVLDLTCEKERVKLITQLDYTRDNLYDCMRANSTIDLEDLQQNYTQCKHDISDWNSSCLNQISALNDTLIHLRIRLNESNVSE